MLALICCLFIPQAGAWDRTEYELLQALWQFCTYDTKGAFEQTDTELLNCVNDELMVRGKSPYFSLGALKSKFQHKKRFVPVTGERK